MTSYELSLKFKIELVRRNILMFQKSNPSDKNKGKSWDIWEDFTIFN